MSHCFLIIANKQPYDGTNPINRLVQHHKVVPKPLFKTFSNMEMKQLNLVALSFAFITILIYAWRVLNWMWLRPKRLERCLKQQGLAGNSYRQYGDFKEMSMMIKEATSRPISISDDNVQRVAPFHYHSIKKYGKHMDFWFPSRNIYACVRY